MACLFSTGVDDNCDVDREYLEGIYHRIKQKPFQPAEDHTNTVIRLEKSVIGDRPVSQTSLFVIRLERPLTDWSYLSWYESH